MKSFDASLATENPSDRGASNRIVPILLYHSIANDPSAYVRPFTVDVDTFRKQLDIIVAAGRTPLNVSELVNKLRSQEPLPECPLVITFDDGYSNFSEMVTDALRERGLAATLYVTTGFLSGRPKLSAPRPFHDRMLSWSQLTEIARNDVEIGAHSHSHPELDTLSRQKAWKEITVCKQLLEEELAAPVLSFAYPHGYSSPSVRRLVHEAGYQSACGVKNALSSTIDDPLGLARLTVQANTTIGAFTAWIYGRGAPTASPQDSPATRIWRFHRRTRTFVRRRRED
jgi:peptidoglycan/xylan/chitin deacetylase (PgdA/CDA1 family)